MEKFWTLLFTGMWQLFWTHIPASLYHMQHVRLQELHFKPRQMQVFYLVCLCVVPRWAFLTGHSVMHEGHFQVEHLIRSLIRLVHLSSAYSNEGNLFISCNMIKCWCKGWPKKFGCCLFCPGDKCSRSTQGCAVAQWHSSSLQLCVIFWRF